MLFGSAVTHHSSHLDQMIFDRAEYNDLMSLHVSLFTARHQVIVQKYVIS